MNVLVGGACPPGVRLVDPLSRADRVDPLGGTDRWPVVVVGAGPAGLVAAIALARADVPVLVLNRRTGVSALPRATALSVRTMELLRSWGLEPAVRAGGHDVEWRMLISPTLVDVGAGRAVEVGFPSRAESALVSPTTPAAVPQDHLETMLLDHLRSLPTARLLVGTALEDLWETAAGWELRVRDVGSGASRVLTAGYVIGADGGRSTVRERLGIGVWSSGRTHESLTALFHAPLWQVVGRHRYGIYNVDGPTPGTFLPAGQTDRWVYGFGWDPAVERLTDYPAVRLIDRIRAAVGVPRLQARVTRVSSFGFDAALANRFSSGRAFLVGDAAHRVTPRGGTGLNTAVADGFNLGWKLSWVLKGWARPALLDSYERERRPVAEHNLARSLDPAGSRRPAVDELPMDLGGRIAHHWLSTATGRQSTLDLLTAGLSWLTAEPVRAPGAVPASVRRMVRAAGLTAPIAVHRLDRQSAVALGLDRHGGLLVRPDGLALSRSGATNAVAGDDLSRLALAS